MIADYKEIEDTDGRLFVIGDIHGCDRELGMMLDHLKSEQGFSEQDQLVFIGDYIDRGPDSKAVIDRLLKLQKQFYKNTTFLRGNHEDMLLGFVGLSGQGGDVFIRNGGDTTLKSYGLGTHMAPEQIRSMLPPDHLAFIMQLEKYAVTEKFIFAHAGLNPKNPWQKQEEGDLYWIREGFIDERHDYNRTVVFGHTPFDDVFINMPYAIGVDTGLVFNNALTCIELSGGMVYQVGYGETRIYEVAVEKKIRGGARSRAMDVEQARR